MVYCVGARNDSENCIAELCQYTQLNHTPFIAIMDDCGAHGENTHVIIVRSAQELIRLHPNIKIIAQWRGKRSSDFFEFTVGDVKRHMDWLASGNRLPIEEQGGA